MHETTASKIVQQQQLKDKSSDTAPARSRVLRRSPCGLRISHGLSAIFSIKWVLCCSAVKQQFKDWSAPSARPPNCCRSAISLSGCLSVGFGNMRSVRWRSRIWLTGRKPRAPKNTSSNSASLIATQTAKTIISQSRWTNFETVFFFIVRGNFSKL